MTKENLKSLVKQYFNLTEKAENIENPKNTSEEKAENFSEATLVDGTKVTNMLDSEFEVGQELHVILEDGTHVIAPEGDHQTESGIMVTVDAEGKIVAIARPDESAEEEEMSSDDEELKEETKEEMAEDEMETEEVAMEDGEIKEAIIEAIADIVVPEIEAMKQKMAEIEEKMKEYMSAPATESTQEAKFKKLSFKAETTKSDSLISQLKNKRYEQILNKTKKTK